MQKQQTNADWPFPTLANMPVAPFKLSIHPGNGSCQIAPMLKNNCVLRSISWLWVRKVKSAPQKMGVISLESGCKIIKNMAKISNFPPAAPSTPLDSSCSPKVYWKKACPENAVINKMINYNFRKTKFIKIFLEIVFRAFPSNSGHLRSPLLKQNCESFSHWWTRNDYWQILRAFAQLILGHCLRKSVSVRSVLQK